MLPERRARDCTHDAPSRTVRIDTGNGGGTAKSAPGTLLLGAHGTIVGVDVEPGSPARSVLMVGRHEDVQSTRDARLSVARDARGNVAYVIVHDVDAPKPTAR